MCCITQGLACAERQRRPSRAFPVPPELPSPCGTLRRHQAAARRPPWRRQPAAELAGGVQPSTSGWSLDSFGATQLLIQGADLCPSSHALEENERDQEIY